MNIWVNLLITCISITLFWLLLNIWCLVISHLNSRLNFIFYIYHWLLRWLYGCKSIICEIVVVIVEGVYSNIFLAILFSVVRKFLLLLQQLLRLEKSLLLLLLLLDNKLFRWKRRLVSLVECIWPWRLRSDHCFFIIVIIIVSNIFMLSIFWLHRGLWRKISDRQLSGRFFQILKRNLTTIITLPGSIFE